MAVYKVTLMVNQSVMGASESLYTADGSLTQTVSRINTYLANRFALYPPAVNSVGVRVSLYGAKRQSVALLPPYDLFPQTTQMVQIPSVGSYKGSGETATPDQFRAVLQSRISYSATRTVLRYMSGIPDGVSRTEPATISFADNLQWYQLLATYYAGLVSDGWQIRARTALPADPICIVTGVVSQSPGVSLLGIQVAAATAEGIKAGNHVTLSGFRPAKFTRSPTINGLWTVDSVNSTLAPGALTVFLRNSQLVDPATVRTTDNTRMRLVAYSLFPIQDITWVRVGIHKRGRPSMAPRGRRLARPTLDP